MGVSYQETQMMGGLNREEGISESEEVGAFFPGMFFPGI
jgi:hypothetical protein